MLLRPLWISNLGCASQHPALWRRLCLTATWWPGQLEWRTLSSPLLVMLPSHGVLTLLLDSLCLSLPLHIFCFFHLGEKRWLSSGAWVFATQADEALLWKRISASFQASVLSFKAILCLEPDKTACQQIPGQNVKVIEISKALTW